MICLAMTCSPRASLRSLSKRAGSGDDGEDLVLAQDDVVLVFQLALAARVLADQDPVPLLDVHRHALAVVVELAGANRDHLGLLRLLFGGVRDDDAAAHLLLLL